MFTEAHLLKLRTLEIYNCDRIRKAFPQHEIGITLNEEGYSDVEIVIDDKYTGIWIDDWMFLGNNTDDYEFLLQEIINYLQTYNKL